METKNSTNRKGNVTNTVAGTNEYARAITFKVSSGEYITVKNGYLESSISRTSRNKAFNGAIDGMESVILALVVAGVDLGDKNARDAISIAYESICNHLGD